MENGKLKEIFLPNHHNYWKNVRNCFPQFLSLRLFALWMKGRVTKEFLWGLLYGAFTEKAFSIPFEFIESFKNVEKL